MNGNLHFRKQKEEKGPAKTMAPQLKSSSVWLGPFSGSLIRRIFMIRGVGGILATPYVICLVLKLCLSIVL